jgi:hypothetical protein
MTKPLGLLAVLALAGCHDRKREVAACSYEPGSAQAGGVTGCLMLRYGWSQRDALVAEADLRAENAKAGEPLRGEPEPGTHRCQRTGDTAWTTCPN